MKKSISIVLSLLMLISGTCFVSVAQPDEVYAASYSISCSSSAVKNSTNTITFKGKKNTKYYIRVRCPKGSWSSSKTVTGSNKVKKSNSSGKAVWKFKVGSGSTSKGTYRIYVYSDKSCKKNLATKTFKVK